MIRNAPDVAGVGIDFHHYEGPSRSPRPWNPVGQSICEVIHKNITNKPYKMGVAVVNVQWKFA